MKHRGGTRRHNQTAIRRTRAGRDGALDLRERKQSLVMEDKVGLRDFTLALCTVLASQVPPRH
jgi:hypothetical protein